MGSNKNPKYSQVWDCESFPCETVLIFANESSPFAKCSTVYIFTSIAETQALERCTMHGAVAGRNLFSRLAEKYSHTHLLSTLPPRLWRILEASSEKGSSSWLTALPLTSHGFALHKGDFRDALCLRFGWQPSSLPLVCICGKPFTVDHALSCSCGGYPSIRHNELRDITATLLTEVSNNVGIEPVLQKLSGEHLTQKTSISSDDARLDIVAENFWGHNRQNSASIRVHVCVCVQSTCVWCVCVCVWCMCVVCVCVCALGV